MSTVDPRVYSRLFVTDNVQRHENNHTPVFIQMTVSTVLSMSACRQSYPSFYVDDNVLGYVNNFIYVYRQSSPSFYVDDSVLGYVNSFISVCMKTIIPQFLHG